MEVTVDLLNKLFGFRWSLYLVTNGNVLRYAMHEHSVIGILGYVMGYYANGGRPLPPWSVQLNFNKKHQPFELLPEHFSPDGGHLSESLLRKIASIDPGYRVSAGEPVFLELPSRRELKISSPIASARTPDETSKALQAMLAGAPEDETFFRVMGRVFGRV